MIGPDPRRRAGVPILTPEYNCRIRAGSGTSDRFAATCRVWDQNAQDVRFLRTSLECESISRQPRVIDGPIRPYPTAGGARQKNSSWMLSGSRKVNIAFGV